MERKLHQHRQTGARKEVIIMKDGTNWSINSTLIATYIIGIVFVSSFITAVTNVHVEQLQCQGSSSLLFANHCVAFIFGICSFRSIGNLFFLITFLGHIRFVTISREVTITVIARELLLVSPALGHSFILAIYFEVGCCLAV